MFYAERRSLGSLLESDAKEILAILVYYFFYFRRNLDSLSNFFILFYFSVVYSRDFTPFPST